MISRSVALSCSICSTFCEVCGGNLLANKKQMPASWGRNSSEQPARAAAKGFPRLLARATALIGCSWTAAALRSCN